ncbi:unnamed protein product, partial [Amoebophrya sp. A120]|eukprot:GSA120T00008228001.1
MGLMLGVYFSSFAFCALLFGLIVGLSLSDPDPEKGPCTPSASSTTTSAAASPSPSPGTSSTSPAPAPVSPTPAAATSGSVSSTSPTPTPTPAASSPTPTPAPAPTPAAAPTPAVGVAGSGAILFTNEAGDSNTRRQQFFKDYTTLETVTFDGKSIQARAVHSSGGVADWVVSEGQGYGVWMGAATVAGFRVANNYRKATGNAAYNTAVQETYEAYLGWRQMCYLSRDNDMIDRFYCGANCPHAGEPRTSAPNCYPCLPHWKTTDNLQSVVGKGSASDGDLDGIVGMILLVISTAPDRDEYTGTGSDPQNTWNWQELALLTYQSCKSNLMHNFVTGTGVNSDFLMLKLGTNWGGFDPECNNPSYHGPGAYRAMRDYMLAFETIVGAPAGEAQGLVAQWNMAVAGTYGMLKDNQCADNGMTTNWFKVSATTKVGTGGGDTSCSGSGTDATEYGSEAARGVWRVATDLVWYGDKTIPEGSQPEGFVRDTTVDSYMASYAPFGPASYLDKMNAQLDKAYVGGSCGGACWKDDLAVTSWAGTCPVKKIHSSWQWNWFMFCPTMTSLVYDSPTPTSHTKKELLDAAGKTIGTKQMASYYAAAWLAIGTISING